MSLSKFFFFILCGYVCVSMCCCLVVLLWSVQELFSLFILFGIYRAPWIWLDVLHQFCKILGIISFSIASILYYLSTPVGIPITCLIDLFLSPISTLCFSYNYHSYFLHVLVCIFLFFTDIYSSSLILSLTLFDILLSPYIAILISAFVFFSCKISSYLYRFYFSAVLIFLNFFTTYQL